MDVFEAIKKRRSIRKYLDKPVPEEHLEKLLEAARLAPSSSNIQSWKFKVVTDPDVRKQLKEAAMGQKFVEQAPVVIVCCLDFDAFKDRGKQALGLVLRGAVRPNLEMIMRSFRGSGSKDLEGERVVINGTVNVAIAVEHIALAATSLGLGTCWIRAFDSVAVEKMLNLPESLKALCLMTVGYPDEDPGARPRKTREQIIL